MKIQLPQAIQEESASLAQDIVHDEVYICQPASTLKEEQDYTEDRGTENASYSNRPPFLQG